MGYSKTLGVGDNFEFGGTITANVQITTTPTDISLGSITLPSTISGELKHVFVDLDVSSHEDTSNFQNHLMSDTVVRVTKSGSYSTALTIADNTWSNASGFQYYLFPSKRFWGSTDVKDRFAIGGTTTVTFIQAYSLNTSKYIHDVQPIARVVL